MTDTRTKKPTRSRSTDTSPKAGRKPAATSKAAPVAKTPAAKTPAKAPLFEVRRSAIQGRGVFAARAIRKGTRIIEYVGERISQREANRRYVDEDMKRHHTFLFSVDPKTCIDAAHEGNEARFINHSCEPNCEALLEEGRIFIYATRALAKGDELSYDYQYIVEGPIDEATRRMYICRCGAPACRGSILKDEPAPKPKKRTATPKRADTKAKAPVRRKSPRTTRANAA